MELVESYVSEVSKFLPADQRDEIVHDLEASIVEEVDARAEAAGREASDEDVKAVLAGFGHPLKTAGQYQPQKYLIGPELYPVFARTMKTVLSLAFVAQVIGILVLALSQDWQIGPVALFWMTVEILLWVMVVVFGVFVAIEFSGERLNWYQDWRPSMLSPGTLGVIDRGDEITNILSEGFFLLWFNGVVVVQNFLPDGVLTVNLAPIWETYAWHLNLLFGASFLLHVYVLTRGVWQRSVLIAEMVIYAAFLGLGFVLLTADALVIAGGELLERITVLNLDRTARIIIIVIMGFTIWDLWLDIKMMRGRQYGAAEASA